MTTNQPEPLPQRIPGATFAADKPAATVHAPTPVPTPPVLLVTTREETK